MWYFEDVNGHENFQHRIRGTFDEFQMQYLPRIHPSSYFSLDEQDKLRFFCLPRISSSSLIRTDGKVERFNNNSRFTILFDRYADFCTAMRFEMFSCTHKYKMSETRVEKR